MKSSSKTKIFLSIIISIVMVLTIVGTIFYFLSKKNNKEVLADDSIPNMIQIQKVSYPNNNIAQATAENNNILQTLKSSGQTIMLTNNQAIIIRFNTNEKLETTNDSYTYLTLSTNCYFNGSQIAINETITEELTANRSFYQIIGLNKSTATDNKVIVASEGQYKFVFEYSQKDNTTGAVLSKQTKTVYFNLVKESTYKNKLNTSKNVVSDADGNLLTLEPRLYNTTSKEFSFNDKNVIISDERINNLLFNLEQNYFNYNNTNTVGYDKAISAKSTSKLLFPTLSYDVTKYNISYTKTLYGTTHTYQYIFTGYSQVDGKDVALVDLFVDSVKQSTLNISKLTYIDSTTPETNYFYYINDIEISDIGQYSFLVNFVIPSFDNTLNKVIYVIDSNQVSSTTSMSFIKKEHWDLTHSLNLYEFGYQLNYSDYSSSVSKNLEFKNEEYLTDVTFLNNNSTFTDSVDSSFLGASITKLSLSNSTFTAQIASTNQAPVSLSYYATMTLSSNKTESYYLYWPSVEKYNSYYTDSASNSPTITANIANNTRFTKNGYYQVFIKYTFDMNQTANTVCYQYFSFAINNSEPEITVQENNTEGKILTSNSFTNQNVYVSWNANTDFDIKPRVIVEKAEFGENKTYSSIYDVAKNINSTSFGIEAQKNSLTIKKSENINTNGKYKVLIYYGPGTSTYVVFRFTIDYTDIQNVKSYNIGNQTETDKLYNSNGELTTNNYNLNNYYITDSNFVLNWDNKISGAEISATYTFIPLEGSQTTSINSDNAQITYDLIGTNRIIATNGTINSNANLSELVIHNGYKLSNVNSNIPYTKGDIKINLLGDNNTITLSNVNAIRTSAGIYLFTLTDSAGNVSYKAVFLDNSKATLIKYVSEDSSSPTPSDIANRFQITSGISVASRDSVIIWGDYKGINTSGLLDNLKVELGINDEEEIKYLLHNYGFDSTELNGTLKSKIKSISIKTLRSNSEYKTITYSTDGTFIQYQILQIKANTNYDNFTGDAVYEFTITDIAGNEKNYSHEMNTDNSLLMAFTNNDASKNNDNYRLYEGGISNRNKLFIEWKAGTGTEFEVKSILYSFYPLKFDQTSIYYPYSSTPIINDLDLTKAKESIFTKQDKIMVDTGINLTSEKTVEGMYIFTREYLSVLSPSDGGNITGDWSPRNYVFFIDRNAVVSYASSGNLIGEKIGIKMGSDTTFSGSELLENTNNSTPKFVTSKMPAKFMEEILLLNKFDSYDKPLTDIANSTYTTEEQQLASQIFKAFKLYHLTISYVSANGWATDYPLKIIYDSKKQSSLQLDNLYNKNGYYKIVITDKSGYKTTDSDQSVIDNKNSNFFEFIFQINVKEPSTNIIKYAINEATQNKEFVIDTNSNISINNNNIIVSWNNPTTDYEAKIDNNNFKINMVTENNKRKQLLYEINNGTVSSIGLIKNKISVKEKTDAINDNFTNASWDYYIDFSEIMKLLGPSYNGISMRLTLSLHYIGNENDFMLKSGLTDSNPINYYSTKQNITFDYKKPSEHYEDLIKNDIFLKNYYDTANDLQNSITNFSNNESTINYENFAFIVNENTTLKQIDTPEPFTETKMDVNQIWIRQYNKYANNEQIANQQSITPDDPRYNDMTKNINRYRFNENYTIDGENIYKFVEYNNETSQGRNITNLIKSAYEDPSYICTNKYFEIIEMDEAGNYRVFSIYIQDKSNTEISYLTGESEKTATATSSISMSYENNEIQKINSCYLKFTDLTYVDEQRNDLYYYITVLNQNTGKTTVITYSPNDSINNYIASLNAIVSKYNQATGNTYIITIQNSLGENLIIEHRKPGDTYPSYNIVATSTNINVSFTVDSESQNNSAYIVSYKAYKATNGIVDFNGTPVEEVPVGDDKLVNNNTYTFTYGIAGTDGGDYWFEFEDNFGRIRREHKIIGIVDYSEKVIYDANVIGKSIAIETESKTVNYTNGQVQIRYQSQLYSFNMLKYDYSATTLEKTEFSSTEIDEYISSHNGKKINGMITFNLFTTTGDTADDKNIIYKVDFTDSAKNVQTYYLCYYDTLASIKIKKVSDSKEIFVNEQAGNTYDGQIYIEFDNTDELFPTKVTGTREYINETNESITENLGNVTSEQNFTNIGSYTFTATNELGTTKIYRITLKEKINYNYWVTSIINGVESGRLTEYSGDTEKTKVFYTIYDYQVSANTSKGYSVVQVNSEQTTDANIVVAVTTTYNIVFNETIEFIVKVVKVTANNNFLRSYNNNLSINEVIQSSTFAKITQTNEGETKSAIVQVLKQYNGIKGNNIIINYYYNSNYVGEFDLNTLETNADNAMLLTLIDSGVYDFYFSDRAGNRQAFGNNFYFRMILLNDILFNVNDKQAVDNAVFNGNVVIQLQQVSQFDNAQITLIAYRNGQEIIISKINNTFTFTEYGIYNITLSGKVNGKKLNTTYNFRILNSSEAMATFEYTGLNNYEIYKIEKLETLTSITGTNVTEIIKQQIALLNVKNEDDSLENNYIKNLTSIALSSLQNGIGGAGIYKIYVEARYTSSKPTQTFSFIVWINSDNEVLIKSSIDYGSSTTSNILLTLNKTQIFNKVGECYVMLNDSTWIDITSASATQNLTEIYTISANGTYNVKIVSKSGNTLSSFVITKNEPLNAVAIIVIVLSCLAVGTVVFIFIKLRKNMRVK